MIKALLLIGGLRYNVTNDIKNWDEMDISEKRKDLGGVVRSFANKFEFAGDAYRLLEEEYLKNYLKSSAVLVISLLNDSLTYNEKFRCTLDFSTRNVNGYILSIHAFDDNNASIIHANKSQVYDISVSELNPVQLYYDRIELNNKANFTVVPTEQGDVSDLYVIDAPRKEYVSFPVGYTSTAFPVKNIIDIQDQYVDENIFDLGNYWTKAITGVNVSIRIKFDIETIADFNNFPVFYLALLKKGEGNVGVISRAIKSVNLPIGGVTNIDITESVELSKDDRLVIYVYRYDLLAPEQSLKFKITNLQEISVSYIGRNKPVLIDVFTPNALLSAILSKMNIDLPGEVTPAVVQPGGMGPLPWVMAAESIRGMPNAKVHTSFSKFAEWLKALMGYEYEVTDTKVVFKHMTSFYDTSEVRPIEFVNSLDVSTDESLIFSGVEIGYSKKDYDEINGRDEVHFTNSFSTGLNFNDNILKLISPYRADCYGIEFLAEKREEETKDDQSDNDVFFVDAYAELDNPYLILNRQGRKPTGVLFPHSVFNLYYTPKRMLMANRDHVFISADRLDFTATDGNADLVFEGVSEKDSIVLSGDRLIRVERIQADTVGLYPFPAGYRGVLMFSYAGKIYEGYVSDITESLGRAKTTNYELMCKNIE